MPAYSQRAAAPAQMTPPRLAQQSTRLIRQPKLNGPSMRPFIDLQRIYAARPSLKLRRSECRIALRKLTKSNEGLSLDFGNDRMFFRHGTSYAAIEKAVLEQLAKIAQRPYTAKEVRVRLAITNQERLRWTKDRRLPRGQDSTIRRGQEISVPTYSVKGVDDLARKPEIIEGWRLEDTRYSS